MLLGVIADDFTGASDIANTLARGGMATTQFLGLQDSPAPAGCEAGVVSLKSRSIAAADAVRESLAALRWLQAQGCRQFVFKYCSTFDSTPAGNIGPVGEALAEALDAWGVVACPAFPATGRTVFQGHLFVGDRLLSDSSMRHHPLNPMTDPDLRRWLRQQTRTPVGLVPHAIVARGAEAVRRALEASASRGERLAIVDAVDERDLHAIGAACAQAKLVTGGSGIALGLPRHFARDASRGAPPPPHAGIAGDSAILAGSCAARTLEQVQQHCRTHPSLEIVPEDVLHGRANSATAVAFLRQHGGEAPIVFSSAQPSAVASVQQAHGRDVVAHALERFFGEVAAQAVAAGVKRLVVAGGETSGAVVASLGLRAVEVGPEIDPGVPVLFAPGVALALKSGNFGGIDFFDKALGLMERPA